MSYGSYLLSSQNPNNNGVDYTQVSNSPVSGGGNANGAWGLLGQGIQDTINIGFGIYDRWRANENNKLMQKNFESQQNFAREQFEYAKYANENAAQIHAKDMAAAGLSPFAEGGAEGNFSSTGAPSVPTPTQATTQVQLGLADLWLKNKELDQNYKLGLKQLEQQKALNTDNLDMQYLIASIKDFREMRAQNQQKEFEEMKHYREMYKYMGEYNLGYLDYLQNIHKQQYEETWNFIKQNTETEKFANQLQYLYTALKTETSQKDRQIYAGMIENTINHLWNMIPHIQKSKITKNQFGGMIWEKYGFN